MTDIAHVSRSRRSLCTSFMVSELRKAIERALGRCVDRRVARNLAAARHGGRRVVIESRQPCFSASYDTLGVPCQRSKAVAIAQGCFVIGAVCGIIACYQVLRISRPKRASWLAMSIKAPNKQRRSSRMSKLLARRRSVKAVTPALIDLLWFQCSRRGRLRHTPLLERRRGAIPIDIAELQLPGTLIAAVVAGLVDSRLCIWIRGLVQTLLSISTFSIGIRRERVREW